MSPFFCRAASSVFVKALHYVYVKHPPWGCLRSLVLAQNGGSTDRAELPPCPPPYKDSLSPPPFKIYQNLSLFAVQ